MNESGTVSPPPDCGKRKLRKFVEEMSIDGGLYCYLEPNVLPHFYQRVQDTTKTLRPNLAGEEAVHRPRKRKHGPARKKERHTDVDPLLDVANSDEFFMEHARLVLEPPRKKNQKRNEPKIKGSPKKGKDPFALTLVREICEQHKRPLPQWASAQPRKSWRQLLHSLRQARSALLRNQRIDAYRQMGLSSAAAQKFICTDSDQRHGESHVRNTYQRRLSTSDFFVRLALLQFLDTQK